MDTQADISRSLGHLKNLAPAGFAMALHVRFTTPTYLFQTYPKEWIDYYSQNSLVMRDPTVHWGFENTGAARWADLAAMDTDGIIGKAASYGMKFGFTYAAEAGGTRSLTSFTRADRDFTDPEVTEIATEVDRMHALTADAKSLTEDIRAALRQMSISFAHP
jgi:LuxR family transcriptional regulator, quorum-sensing system regulator SdiA